MSFHAYIDNIKAKTGNSPEDFKAKAEQADILKPDMTAGQLKAWLVKEYGLGHGHCMALWKYFKDHDWVNGPK